MKTPHIIAAALAAFMSITPIVSAEAFLRPTVYWVSPTADGYDNEVGYGLQGGSYFGSKDEHELSFEIAHASWDFAGTVALGFSTYNYSVEETWMPVLLNYRYHFTPTAESPIRFYIGPSLGFTNYEIEVSVTNGFSHADANDSEWAFTMSGSAGVVFQIAERVELDIGYRYIHIDETEVTLAGTTFEGEVSKAHIFYAGLGFKF